MFLCRKFPNNQTFQVNIGSSGMAEDGEEGASSSPYCDPWWWERALTSTNTCRACNGYYGPCFSEPVCPTCHAFLYASSLEQVSAQIFH